MFDGLFFIDGWDDGWMLERWDDGCCVFAMIFREPEPSL
jgi:hypothetical protein